MDVDTSEDPTEPQPMEEPLHCRPPELVDFLERAPVGLHWVGPDGSILWANQTELELLGYPREEYIGHHIAEFHADADVLADILQRLTHHETVHDYEARLRCKDGAIKHVLIDANVRWEDGRFIHTRCVTRDITAHRQIAQHVATQHAVTRSLAESATLAAATPSMLQAICEGLGWEMGVVWCIDPHANVLRCLDLWQAPAVTVGEFAALSRQRTFAPGIGLPGRIWASGTPAWVADITRDDNFPRAPVAAREGLHGAFGFPILYGREILGVVECFSRTIRQPDEALLQMMATIGSQIGQFMARKRVEEALEQSRRRLQALFDHALDAILLANDEACYVDANPAACALTGYSREELLQLTVWDLTPVPNHQRGRQLWDMFIAGVHQSGEYTLRCKDGTLVEIEYHAVANIVPGLHLSVLHDITARKRVEERQRFLTEASVGLAASLDYETTLAGLTRCIVPTLADWCVIDMFEEDGWVHRRALAHKEAEKEALLQELKCRYPRLHLTAMHTLLRVLDTRQSWLRPELPAAQGRAEARDARHWEILQALGFSSEMVVPLLARGRVLGTITFVLGPGHRRYGPDDLALAEELARRCALAIDNARLYREAQEAKRARGPGLL